MTATSATLERQTARLRNFILFDAATTMASFVFMMVTYLTVVPNLWLLAAGGVVALGGMVMILGLRPLARGDVTSALTYLAAANWGIGGITCAIAIFAWPIMLLASLLPVIFAVPYVTPRQLQRFVAGSFILSIAAVILGMGPDYSGLTDAAPTWVKNTVLLTFTPFMSLLVIQAGLASSRELQATLDEALDANDALTASRARVVAATDRERRRIERDLHDGAQQRLVGMSMQLSMARDSLESDPAATDDVLVAMREQVRQAQRELRELVRGVYPPVLTEHGLPAALRALGDQPHLPVWVKVAEVGRYDSDVEAAVYFCVLEALQNAAKHAGEVTAVGVTLTREGDELVFEVRDDGVGFDASDRLWGSGFNNMEDRLGASGGTLSVTSKSGEGTVVTGCFPVGES